MSLLKMNNPAAPNSGISASLRQAIGYQTGNFKHPKVRGIKSSSAKNIGGLEVFAYHIYGDGTSRLLQINTPSKLQLLSYFWRYILLTPKWN
jgi:hypothetical protein